MADIVVHVPGQVRTQRTLILMLAEYLSKNRGIVINQYLQLSNLSVCVAAEREW